MRKLLILAALAATSIPALAQDDGAGTVTARQVVVPLSDMFGGKPPRPTDKERDEAKEARRHDRAIEKEIRRLAKDNRFAFARGPKDARKPGRVRSIPPWSNKY